jgi:hypothetical protein
MMPAVEAAEALADEVDRPAADLLRCFVDGWWQSVGATPLGSLPKLLVAESGNFPDIAQWFHEAMVDRAQKAMARIIKAGVASGEFRAVDAESAALTFFTPMFSYLIWQRAFGPAMCKLPPPEQFFAATVDLLIHGLANTTVSEEPRP